MNCRGAIILLLCLACLASCQTSGRSSQLTPAQTTGLASWYGDPFHGRTTASGETYDKSARTAAHRTLPFGTNLRVTNMENGKFVDVRINDHFPGTKGRVIDLSEASFARIARLEQGIVRVRLEILQAID